MGRNYINLCNRKTEFHYTINMQTISTGNYQTNLSAQPKVNHNSGLRPKLTPQIKLSLRLWSERKSEQKVKVAQCN